MTQSEPLAIPTSDSFVPLEHQQPTQPHGSISNDGQSITKHLQTRSLDEILVGYQTVVEANASKPQEVSLRKAKPLPPSTVQEQARIPFTAEDRAQLASLLSQVCAMQKAYGKATQDLKALVEGYCLILDRFTMPQITEALKEYMLTRDDIPTPANIACLIDPSILPVSETMVIRIRDKMKNDQFITDKEREYLRRFEQQELRKVSA